MTYLGSYDSFSFLALWKVRENSSNLSTFSLLLKKPNYKNPRRFLYRFEFTQFVIIRKCNTVPCRIFRGISFLNVVMTCARCGKLCTVYSAFANSCPMQIGTFLFSFIATMSYSPQISFNSVMKDWTDKFHVWGTPTRSPSRSNSR